MIGSAGILPVHAPDFFSYKRHLPHWRQTGATYFVTWRLERNLPPLSPNERSLVAAAIEHFNGERYNLAAYVVMDDHVHVLLALRGGWRLDQVLHSWKSFTARNILAVRGEEGPLWQSEYFDRIMRDEQEFLKKAQYILNNPQKRWPGVEDYPWTAFYIQHARAECPRHPL